MAKYEYYTREGLDEIGSNEDGIFDEMTIVRRETSYVWRETASQLVDYPSGFSGRDLFKILTILGTDKKNALPP